MRLPTPNDDGSYASSNYRLLFKIISTYLCTVFKLILLCLHSVSLINWKRILTDFLIGYRICLLSISKWQVKSVFQNMYVAQLTKLLLGKFKNESEDTNWYWLSFVCEHLGNQVSFGRKEYSRMFFAELFNIYRRKKNNPKNRLCVCHRSHILFPCSNVMCVAYEFPHFVDINKSKSIELWMKLWQNKLIAADE